MLRIASLLRNFFINTKKETLTPHKYTICNLCIVNASIFLNQVTYYLLFLYHFSELMSITFLQLIYIYKPVPRLWQIVLSTAPQSAHLNNPTLPIS